MFGGKRASFLFNQKERYRRTSMKKHGFHQADTSAKRESKFALGSDAGRLGQ